MFSRIRQGNNLTTCHQVQERLNLDPFFRQFLESVLYDLKLCISEDL